MSAQPELNECLLAVDGRVATLTFNRNEIRNALTGTQIGAELVKTLLWAQDNPEISVLILTGAGAAFSAGGNVKSMKGRTAVPVHDVQRNYRLGVQQIPLAFDQVDIPVIAAVNGSAIGAGFDVANMCDIRIASTNAQFCETFVNLGIIPGDGGSWFLQRAVGYQKAAELTLTGRMVKAQEAKELGLVIDVVEPDELMPRAMKLARQMAAKPPLALRYSKRLLRQANRMQLADYLDMCSNFQAICHKTDDHAEAMKAFFEKRPGVFQGR